MIYLKKERLKIKIRHMGNFIFFIFLIISFSCSKLPIVSHRRSTKTSDNTEPDIVKPIPAVPDVKAVADVKAAIDSVPAADALSVVADPAADALSVVADPAADADPVVADPAADADPVVAAVPAVNCQNLTEAVKNATEAVTKAKAEADTAKKAYDEAEQAYNSSTNNAIGGQNQKDMSRQNISSNEGKAYLATNTTNVAATKALTNANAKLKTATEDKAAANCSNAK